MEEVVIAGVLPNNGVSYKMIRLEQGHLEEVLHLQNIVVNNLVNADELVPLSEAELRDVLGDKGYCVGIKVAEEMIGFHAMLFPGADDEENLGHDLGLESEARQAVAHLESVFVHPFFRGNGLQVQMAKALLSHLEQNRKYRYVCETIAPSNLASLKNALASGLHIAQLKQKYGGLWRYIMYQDVYHPVQLDQNTIQMIHSEDYELQRSLLSTGFRGFAMTTEEEGCFIRFACPI